MATFCGKAFVATFCGVATFLYHKANVIPIRLVTALKYIDLANPFVYVIDCMRNGSEFFKSRQTLA